MTRAVVQASAIRLPRRCSSTPMPIAIRAAAASPVPAVDVNHGRPSVVRNDLSRQVDASTGTSAVIAASSNQCIMTAPRPQAAQRAPAGRPARCSSKAWAARSAPAGTSGAR